MKLRVILLCCLLTVGLIAQGLRDPAFLGVVGAGSQIGLSFTTQPDGGINGVNFTQQPVVVAPGYSGNVTISKIYGSGTLSGTLTVAAAAGVATFTDLKITGTGPHVLQATATGFNSARSGVATIMPAAATTRTVLTFGSNTTDVVDFGSAASLDNLGSGTFSVVTRLKRNNTGNNQYFATKYNTGDTGWAISIDDSITAGDLAVNFGRTVDALVVGKAAITTTTPWDVAFTWNVNDGTRQVRTYAAPVGTAMTETSYDATSTQGSGSADTDAGANFYAGNLQIVFSNPLKGSLDWMAVYQTNLTTAQLLQVQIGFDRADLQMLTNIAPCRLLAAFTNATTVPDLSGQANNGTVTGATTTNNNNLVIYAPTVFGMSPPLVDMTNFLYQGSHSEISWSTTATQVVAGVQNSLNGTYAAQSAIKILTNGVYFGQMLAASTNLQYLSSGLPTGTKTVTLQSSVASNPTGVSDRNEGVWIVSARFNSNATEVTPFTPTNHIVVMNDSILDGFVADPEGSFGVLAKLRQDIRATNALTILGGGGWQMFDFASNSTVITATVSNIAQLNPDKLLIELGINDKGRGDWDTNAFYTGYSNFLNSVHTELPALQIKVVTPVKIGTGASSIYEIWRVMIRNACTNRSYVTVTEGDPTVWDGSNPGSDGTHPGNTSSTNYILPAIKTALGL